MVRKNLEKNICIVIPAFNEEVTIGNVITGLKKYFKKASYQYEIVVVNDGSKDHTRDVAKKQGATVIDHILNTGAGGATATGLSYAGQNGFDIAVTLDADGQHSAEDVLKGIHLSLSTKTDLLVGSRLINSKGMSKVKVIGNMGLSLITRILFGINVTDSQSGLRIFSRKALEQLRWETSGYEFCSEMLWRAKQMKLVIDEYPIEAIYTEYSRSKGQNNWNAVNIVKSLIKRRLTEMFE